MTDTMVFSLHHAKIVLSSSMDKMKDLRIRLSKYVKSNVVNDT